MCGWGAGRQGYLLVSALLSVQGCLMLQFQSGFSVFFATTSSPRNPQPLNPECQNSLQALRMTNIAGCGQVQVQIVPPEGLCLSLSLALSLSLSLSIHTYIYIYTHTYIPTYIRTSMASGRQSHNKDGRLAPNPISVVFMALWVSSF